jgi:Na+-translocating ferredoxin:NAD+ oxidoreductase RnfC subunit
MGCDKGMSILKQIEQAGIVGAGGAGFPTHAKLKAKVEYLIINGAECEPLLQTDRYIIKNYAKEVVEGILQIKEEVGATYAVVATKAYYKEEVAIIQEEISRVDADINLHLMDNYYPAGDEQVMVYEVTKRVVPPGGIPLMVGCIVINISSVYHVYNAVIMEKPVTTKQLTVIGAVKEPTLMEVPIGTSFDTVLKHVGGATITDYLAIDGGPMMGTIYTPQELSKKVVTKTTSALIIKENDGYLNKLKYQSIKRMLQEAKVACVQCTICTDLCPRHMIGHDIFPHRVMRYFSGVDINEINNNYMVKSSQICCACGVCEVIACPMGISPRQVNLHVKDALDKQGIKYDNTQEEYTIDPMREYRGVFPRNILIKMGLTPYENMSLTTMKKVEVGKVTIPLKMHIGAPSMPVVKVGDKVKEGDLIADIPQDALGAKIHASIMGEVVVVSEQEIRIAN